MVELPGPGGTLFSLILDVLIWRGLEVYTFVLDIVCVCVWGVEVNHTYFLFTVVDV